MIHNSMESHDARQTPRPHHNDNVGIIWRGTRTDFISLKIEDGLLWVSVEREVRGEDLRACFEYALATGAISTSMRTLVDLRRFHGSIDWSAIYAIRDMAEWGADGMSRVAYVVRHASVGMLFRLIRDLFPRCRHQAFASVDAALDWVRS